MLVGFGQENNKFFATEPADQVAVTQSFGAQLGEAFQHLIACQMTILVIDPFKMVEIDEDQGNRMMIADCPLDFLLGQLDEVPAIQDLRQSICRCQSG